MAYPPSNIRFYWTCLITCFFLQNLSWYMVFSQNGKQVDPEVDKLFTQQMPPTPKASQSLHGGSKSEASLFLSDNSKRYIWYTVHLDISFISCHWSTYLWVVWAYWPRINIDEHGLNVIEILYLSLLRLNVFETPSCRALEKIRDLMRDAIQMKKNELPDLTLSKLREVSQI